MDTSAAEKVVTNHFPPSFDVALAYYRSNCMVKYWKFVVFACLLGPQTLCAGAPLTQRSSIGSSNPIPLQLRDFVYDPYIKTVQLSPALGSPESALLPAVAPIGRMNLQLQFDDLNDRLESYNVRIVHCEKGWTKSNLADLEFLSEYNEFPINRYEFSIDTKISYVHYWFDLPQVKLPGNYVLVVYRGTDRDDILLSKRFMVYQSLVTMKRSGSLIGPGQVADMNQQINFILNYENTEILNPMQDVYVTIRQNMRWDVTMENIKPSFVREDLHEIEYRFFDPEKLMKGGNEFRFFDLRSIYNPGQNIATVDRDAQPITAYVMPDKSREHEAYAQYEDLNGQYIAGNRDPGGFMAANYCDVYFSLKSKPIDGKVFVTGAFCQWNKDAAHELKYFPDDGEYRGSALLKQGWYDYQYIVESPTLPPWHFEGTHFETENVYEIFVYLRRTYQPADVLIGYFKVQENPR